MDDAPHPTIDSGLFHLHRAAQSDYEIGAFRRWAGYRNLGVDDATQGLAHFQHVLSFGPPELGGRTGVHCHLAQVHLVIPTSGRGVFSYDGVVTEATPGAVIVQHGGTVHDQFQYSYAATSEADNRLTPQSVEPVPANAHPRSFGFLELFVPQAIAHVEIVAPADVTADDQATAWAHPYHAPEEYYALQAAEDPDAAFRPLQGRPDLEARDAGTWAPTGGMLATWIVRPASGAASGREPISLDIPSETGGLEVLYMVAGSAVMSRSNGEVVTLDAGDTLTCSQGLVGPPTHCSPDRNRRSR